MDVIQGLGKVFRRLAHGLVVAGALVLFSALTSHAEPSSPVPLTPGVSADRIERAARYLPDEEQGLSMLRATFAAGGGATDLQAALDARERAYQPVWAYIPVENAGLGGAGDGGSAEDRWVLTSATYGLLALEAYVLDGAGEPAAILSHAYDEPYDLAEHSASRLRSDAFTLERGASATLLVRLKFGPVEDVRLSLETVDDLTSREFHEGFRLAAFYAFTVAMLVFFFGFHLSLSNGIGVAYSGLFLLGLVLIAYVDGLTFRFIYPDTPDWHFPFGVVVMNLLSAAGFLVAGHALRNQPKIGANIGRLALVPLGVLPGVLLLPQEIVALASYALVLGMFGLQSWVIWRLRRENGEPHVVERGVALTTTVAIALLIGMIVTGLGAGVLSPPAMLRALYGLVGLLSMLALTMALVELRRQHAQAVEARIEALEQEAESARARLEAERRYAKARDLAELRQRRLATASHDIRQPLSALRMRMSAAGERLSETERGGMMQALDYLESLSTDYLSEARPGGAPNEADEPEPEGTDSAVAEAEPARVDPYPVSLVLGAVRQMFTEDAISKGLRLRVIDRSLQTVLDPLAVIRIVSNLTSNAIRHTETGRVVVGARSRGDAIEIVVADTGPGFAEGAFETFSRAYEKGENSEGEGLGLAICFELAARLGATLEQRAPPGKGACFVLTVPRAGR